jgi:transglutaminase superfamily protein
MKRILLAILIACSLFSRAAAQDDREISDHVWSEAGQGPVRTALLSARRHYRNQRYSNALSVLLEIREMPERDRVPGLQSSLPFGIGCLHSLLNQESQAIDSLQEAMAAGFTNYSYYGEEPDLDPIRLQPRFRLLMADLRKRNGIGPLMWDRRQAHTLSISSDSSGFPNLSRVVPELQLDKLPTRGNTDYNKLLRVARWVSEQWASCDHGTVGATPAVSELGRTCSEHASVMAGAAQASGMPARVVELLPRDVERKADSQAVAEVWLESLRKWSLADGQYGIVPQLNGVPLNAIELQSALASGEEVTCGTDALTCVRWRDSVLQYLFYFEYHQAVAQGGRAPLILKPVGAGQPHSRKGDKAAFGQALYISNPDLLYDPPGAATPH